MQQKILVTGGTGFLGSYLLRYLVENGQTQIFALKRATSKMDLVAPIEDKVDWLEGDLLDIPFLEEAMEGIDLIYHCAAMVSFDPKDFDKMWEVNENGTANLVNIALDFGVKKLVHISSIAAIGKEKEGVLISEATKWKEDKRKSNYSRSKYAAEMQVWRGIAEGLNAAILNPSVIMGSGFWNSSSCEIFRLYGNGFPFYSTGSNGFVDVRDVAKMAILLMESDISAERFLVTGENHPYKKVFELIAENAGVKAPSFKINSILTGLGWRFDALKSWLTGSKPLITKETVGHASDKSLYDNRKSLAAFDFQYTPIETTIAETVRQFLEAKEKGVASMVLPLTPDP
jgi:nucleoside-diphosphate-sugar epimerase